MTILQLVSYKTTTLQQTKTAILHNVQVEKIYRKSKLWLLPLALRGLLASAFLLKVHFQFASKQTARDSQKNQLEVELHFPLFCLLPSGDAFFYDHKSFKKNTKNPTNKHMK